MVDYKKKQVRFDLLALGKLLFKNSKDRRLALRILKGNNNGYSHILRIDKRLYGRVMWALRTEGLNTNGYEK